ncbi:MAG TPA: hypothetical protein VIH03_02495 [Nitrososphaerales archaeon]
MVFKELQTQKQSQIEIEKQLREAQVRIKELEERLGQANKKPGSAFD